LEGDLFVWGSMSSFVGGFLEIFFPDLRARKEAGQMDDQSVEKRTN
jgi:hypothetical protein